MTLLFQGSNSRGTQFYYFFRAVKITNYELFFKSYHPVETLDGQLILYLQPIKNVVSLENDAG